MDLINGEYRRVGIPALHQQKKVTVEAIVGGITGALDDPRTLLLGRIDGRGRRLRYVAGPRRSR